MLAKFLPSCMLDFHKYNIELTTRPWPCFLRITEDSCSTCQLIPHVVNNFPKICMYYLLRDINIRGPPTVKTRVRKRLLC